MTRLLLGVDASRHVTDEVTQMQLGLRGAGWTLCGRGLDVDEVDVEVLLDRLPDAVLLQDRREWDAGPRSWRRKDAAFAGWRMLRDRPEVLRLGVLKDMQSPHWEADLGRDAGLDGWVTPYSPESVIARCPWVDESRLVRTHHTVDAAKVPEFRAEDRLGCLLSGYVGRSVDSIYPLRTRLFARWAELPETMLLQHPGYGEVGCHSDRYLEKLNVFKVAICTVSTRDFLLRKIVEASACGCRVVTNLSERERPEVIEENLIRVAPDASVREVAEAVKFGIEEWDPARQGRIAEAVKARYDWREVGRRLDVAIVDFGRRVK